MLHRVVDLFGVLLNRAKRLPVVETTDRGSKEQAERTRGGWEGERAESRREGEREGDGAKLGPRARERRCSTCTHTSVGTRASMLSMRARIRALHESGRSLLVPAGEDAKHVLSNTAEVLPEIDKAVWTSRKTKIEF